MKTLRGLALIATTAGALQLACNDSVAPPGPGELSVMLQTPNVNDGAIVIRVVGPQPSDPATANEAYVLHSRISGNELRSAVFGSLANGAVLRFKVPDISRQGEYAATLLEVSDSENQLRSDVSGYRVTVVKPTQ